MNGHAFTRPVVVPRRGADEHVRHAQTCGYVAMAVPRERFVADAAARAGVEPEALRLPRRVFGEGGAPAGACAADRTNRAGVPHQLPAFDHELTADESPPDADGG